MTSDRPDRIFYSKGRIVGLFERATKLPQVEQDKFARLLLAELESDQQWAELFSRSESEDLLERLADEAIIAHRTGRTKPLNIEELTDCWLML